jgi:hypothetical protein
MLPNCLTVQPERVQNLPSPASSATLLQPDSAGTDRAREQSLDCLPSSVSPCLVRNSLPESPLLRFGLKPIYTVPCGRVRPHPGRTLAWRPGQPPADVPFEMVLVQVPRNPRVSVHFVGRRPLAPDPSSPPWLPTRAPFLASNPSSFLGCEPEFVLPLASGPPSLPPIALACCVKCRSVWALLRGVCGRLANAPLLQHLSVSNGPRVRPVSCQRATAPHSRACHAPKCCVGVFGGSAPRLGPRTPLIVPSLGSFPSSPSLLAADHRFAQPGAQASLLGGSARLPCKHGCCAENVAVTLCVKATLFR